MYDLDLDVTFKFSLLFVASVATDQKSHMRPTYLSCFHANEGGGQTGGRGETVYVAVDSLPGLFQPRLESIQSLVVCQARLVLVFIRAARPTITWCHLESSGD